MGSSSSTSNCTMCPMEPWTDRWREGRSHDACNLWQTHHIAAKVFRFTAQQQQVAFPRRSVVTILESSAESLERRCSSLRYLSNEVSRHAQFLRRATTAGPGSVFFFFTNTMNTACVVVCLLTLLCAGEESQCLHALPRYGSGLLVLT